MSFSVCSCSSGAVIFASNRILYGEAFPNSNIPPHCYNTSGIENIDGISVRCLYAQCADGSDVEDCSKFILFDVCYLSVLFTIFTATYSCNISQLRAVFFSLLIVDCLHILLPLSW